MSASQDKKKRTQQRADGTERRQVASQKAAKEKKATKTKWIVGSIIVALLVAFIIIGNSNLFYTAQKAVKIGDKSYSIAEYNYEYMSVYQQYNQMYSQYMGDASLCAPSAEYSEDDESGDAFKTWGDFYQDTAIKSLARKQALVDLANQEGVTLTAEETQAIDDQLSDLWSQIEEYNKQNAASGMLTYSNLSQYLTAMYGNGVNEKVARKLMLRDALASKYQTEYEENLTYSDDELQAAYDENKDEYDSFSFSYYLVQAQTDDASAETEDAAATADAAETEDAEAAESTETEETADAAETEDAAADAEETVSESGMADAKALAEKIMSAAQGDAEGAAERFAAAVADLAPATEQTQMDEDGAVVTDDDGNPVTETAPAEPSESEGVQGSLLTTYGMPFGDWLKDAARQPGDMEVVEQEGTGYYVVLFLGRDDNSYSTVNVRHILIQAEDPDGDGVYTDEDLAAAKTEIEKIQAEYEDGEQTEDAFAALAKEYSTDPGSKADGGLYKNVYKGQMVEEFNDWCFDEARKAGDVGIIEDSAYNGYHLMYFVGNGDTYQKVLARDALSDVDMQAFTESLTADLEYQTLFAMRYAG
ncbi:MAG: peptidylprolyl isomerase [Oscillospiraceae bacterium]|nr:peptidylprolyl isomerase [Oscillospiraceae bacterium]